MKTKNISGPTCCALIIAVTLGSAVLWVSGAGKSVKKAPKPSTKTPVRVLFLGNSYTYGCKLPQVVAGMAAADKTVAPMVVKMVASGGKDLIWHSRNKDTLDAIAEGKWDYVVLQDQSLTPAFMPERTWKGAASLDAAIKKAGAKTMFFMTWRRRPNPKRPGYSSDMHKRTSKTYMDIGRQLKASVAPVGYAWKMAYDANPKWPLYSRDGSHSARMGAYLTACVFYSTIYNKPPTRLPAKIVLSTRGRHRTVLGIPPADARKLQPIAWRAVKQAKEELAEKQPETQPATTQPKTKK